jgi:hypothetical protein
MPLSGKDLNDGGFEEVDQAFDAQAGTLEIQQQVSDELSGSVVSHLATAIHLEHRDVTGIQQVLQAASLAQGIDSRVLQEPEFIGSCGVSGVREIPHGSPTGFIVAQA